MTKTYCITHWENIKPTKKRREGWKEEGMGGFIDITLQDCHLVHGHFGCLHPLVVTALLPIPVSFKHIPYEATADGSNTGVLAAHTDHQSRSPVPGFDLFSSLTFVGFWKTWLFLFFHLFILLFLSHALPISSSVPLKHKILNFKI